MRLALINHAHFKHTMTVLQQFMQVKGQCGIFLPKFCCELNPIESVGEKASDTQGRIVITLLLTLSA